MADNCDPTIWSQWKWDESRQKERRHRFNTETNDWEDQLRDPPGHARRDSGYAEAGSANTFQRQRPLGNQGYTHQPHLRLDPMNGNFDYFETQTRRPGTAGSHGSVLPDDTITGRPETGSHEGLDPSYKLRPPEFFRAGRIFSMLFTEAWSHASQQPSGDNVSFVLYGERAYSQIRRFVVVEERRGFCYTLPISTYNGRATLKRGVNALEHGVIYTTQYPQLQDGEIVGKPPVRAETGRTDIWLDPNSRLNYGLVVPIQHNVKVKNLGRVHPVDMWHLIGHYRMERDRR